MVEWGPAYSFTILVDFDVAASSASCGYLRLLVVVVLISLQKRDSYDFGFQGLEFLLV